jgi:hypothetical protein
MHKGSDILSSRNQFSYLFSCDILLGGADQKRRAWNQSTNLVLLLISYTNRQRLGRDFSILPHHYVSLFNESIESSSFSCSMAGDALQTTI